MAGKSVPSTGIICRPGPSLLRRASPLATSSAERQASEIAIRPIEVDDLTSSPRLRVEDGDGCSQTRARPDGIAGHDLGLRSDGTPWGPACPRHHRDPSGNHPQQGARCRINYIDTSIDYGLSEERIGRYISHRRAEYYLASKCGCLVGAPPTPRQRGQHVFTR